MQDDHPPVLGYQDCEAVRREGSELTRGRVVETLTLASIVLVVLGAFVLVVVLFFGFAATVVRSLSA